MPTLLQTQKYIFLQGYCLLPCRIVSLKVFFLGKELSTVFVLVLAFT